jgi:hypothetical protein
LNVERLALIALVITAGAHPQKVELRATTEDQPGVLEVLGADAGVLWRGRLETELTVNVPAADRYQIRLLRDAGVVASLIDSAKGIQRMTVNAERYYLSVQTEESVSDVSVDVTRSPGVASVYVLTNHSDADLVVLPWLAVDGVASLACRRDDACRIQA